MNSKLALTYLRLIARKSAIENDPADAEAECVRYSLESAVDSLWDIATLDVSKYTEEQLKKRITKLERDIKELGG